MQLRAIAVSMLFACGNVNHAAPDAQAADAAEPDASADAAPLCGAGHPVHDALFVTWFTETTDPGGVAIFDCALQHRPTAPSRVITGASTGLKFGWYGGIQFDPARDLLYVSEHSDGTVRVFANASTIAGNTPPARVITTGAQYQEAIALDRVHDRLYVNDDNLHEILVYANASTANGAPQPVAAISAACEQMFYDETNDRLYVAAFSTIAVFDQASAITGNSALPVRTFAPGTSTDYQGIAIDTVHDVAYVGERAASGAVYAIDHASSAFGMVTASRTWNGGVADVSPIELAGDRLFALLDSGNLLVAIAPASAADGATPPDMQLQFGSTTQRLDGFLYVP
jgi:DNA-binding beta-propeller fold protein YncE